MTGTMVRWSAGLALLLGLPLVGTWWRHSAETRCALDGAALVPSYRIRIQDTPGHSYDFCCIRCAQIWLQHRRISPRAIRVTDEASGQEIDASAAWFVRSLVITTPATGNRIHAFQERAAAERHAQKCHGTVLANDELPFAASGGDP